MLDRIYNQISKADVIIADMSGRNANVFYEVGYAHAIGKTNLLVTQKAEDIPFDLKHYPHIIYNGSLTYLKAELAKKLKWHLDNPQERETAPTALAVRVNEVYLKDCPTIEIEDTRGQRSDFRLYVDLNNRSDRWLKTVSFKIGLFAPIELHDADRGVYGVGREICIDASQRLFLPKQVFNLVPDMWASINFSLGVVNRDYKIGEELQFCLRLYFDSGSVNFPFRVHIKS
jgi:hypothetical protein